RSMDPGFTKYLFEYYHDGAWWSLVIPARSEQDAIERINLIPRSKLLGTLEMEISAGPGAGWLVCLICWWHILYRNSRSCSLYFAAVTLKLSVVPSVSAS